MTNRALIHGVVTVALVPVPWVGVTLYPYLLQVPAWPNGRKQQVEIVLGVNIGLRELAPVISFLDYPIPIWKPTRPRSILARIYILWLARSTATIK